MCILYFGLRQTNWFETCLLSFLILLTLGPLIIKYVVGYNNFILEPLVISVVIGFMTFFLYLLCSSSESDSSDRAVSVYSCVILITSYLAAKYNYHFTSFESLALSVVLSGASAVFMISVL
jgi:hypothetical protein